MDGPTGAMEVILEVGGEGWSKTLIGTRSESGWRFRIVTDEGTMYDFLADDDRPAEYRHEDWVHVSDWIETWDAALASLGRHWHRFFPIKVHPDFKQTIWSAVQMRLAEDDDESEHRVSVWSTRCGGNGGVDAAQ